jgi:hypothetical protein
MNTNEKISEIDFGTYEHSTVIGFKERRRTWSMLSPLAKYQVIKTIREEEDSALYRLN